MVLTPLRARHLGAPVASGACSELPSNCFRLGIKSGKLQNGGGLQYACIPLKVDSRSNCCTEYYHWAAKSSLICANRIDLAMKSVIFVHKHSIKRNDFIFVFLFFNPLRSFFRKMSYDHKDFLHIFHYETSESAALANALSRGGSRIFWEGG